MSARILLQASAKGRSQQRISHIARVTGCGGFKQQQFDFGLGNRTMFNAMWHNQKFAFVQLDDSITELDSQIATPHQKQFILGGVVMPHKLALQFDQFDLLAVQRADNFWSPMIGETGEFFS